MGGIHCQLCAASKTSMIVTAVIVPVVLIAILATLAILLIQRRAVTNQKKMLDEIETNKRTLNEYVENQQK
jgi:preprotein translocase subunit YajC